MVDYEIFVDSFSEHRPGQSFKGNGEASVSLRLYIGKQTVWKATTAKLSRPSTKGGPLVWAEKVSLPGEFIAGNNRLEIALIKSGMVYVKDTCDVDLSAHSFPKSFSVPMQKLKGDLSFTIQGGQPPAPKSSSSIQPVANVPSGLSAGEIQALERREKEITRRERELTEKHQEFRDEQANAVQASSFDAPEWRALGGNVNRELLNLRSKLERALKKLDFAACHDIINDMAERLEQEDGGALGVPSLASSRGSSRHSPRLPPKNRTKVLVEQELSFATASGDFHKAIELRDELRAMGGEDSDPFAAKTASPQFPRRPPPIPAHMATSHTPPQTHSPRSGSPRSGSPRGLPGLQSSGVSAGFVGGSDAEIDAEIVKLRNAMASTQALADKWASLGNNGARTAAEEQVAKMDEEIRALESQKGGGGGRGGGSGGGRGENQYAALPIGLLNDESVGSYGLAQAQPPPTGAYGLAQASPPVAHSYGTGQPALPPAVLPPPPSFDDGPAVRAPARRMGRGPSRGPPGRSMRGPPSRGIPNLPPKRPLGAPPPARRSGSARMAPRLPAPAGRLPPRPSDDFQEGRPSPAEMQSRRRSKSMNSLLAAAAGAGVPLTTLDMARSKEARAAEPLVDAMVSQGQRDADRARESRPSAQLADQYHVGNSETATAHVTGAQTKGSGRNAFTAYTIEVVRGSKSWTVYRRYAQFEDMHNALKRSAPSGVPADAMPPKDGKKFDSGVIELRRLQFDKFLKALHQHPTTLSSEELKVFLAPLQLGDKKPT